MVWLFFVVWFLGRECSTLYAHRRWGNIFRHESGTVAPLLTSAASASTPTSPTWGRVWGEVQRWGGRGPQLHTTTAFLTLLQRLEIVTVALAPAIIEHFTAPRLLVEPPPFDEGFAGAHHLRQLTHICGTTAGGEPVLGTDCRFPNPDPAQQTDPSVPLANTGPRMKVDLLRATELFS